MIPYRDDIPCEHPAVITWTLIAVNSVIFLYMIWLPYEGLNSLYYQYGLVPIRYTQPEWAHLAGFPTDYYFSFLSSLFLHASWTHILLNMWMLWIFGDNIEDRMGPARFLMFFLICGVAAGATHMLSNSTSPIATVGASGAIAGVLGAYYLLFPFARIVIWIPLTPIFFPIPAIAFLGFWVIIQIGAATAPASGQDYADVAWWGHLGGFFAGLAIYRFFLRSINQPDNLSD